MVNWIAQWEDKPELIRFWNDVYSYLSQYTNMDEQRDYTKSDLYKGAVFDILHKAKAIKRWGINKSSNED
jgi:hypothetical protein